MAGGLVDQAMNPPQAPQTASPPGMAMGASGNPGGTKEQPASPEEQKAYDQALQIASKILHGEDGVSDQLQKALAVDDLEKSPQAISTVTIMLVDKVEEAMQGQLPETVILSAAEEISELVMEFSEAAGGPRLDNKAVNRSKGMMVKKLLEMYGDDPMQSEGLLTNVTEGDVNKYSEAFGEL